MADKKISELPLATFINQEDKFAFVQGGVTKQKGLGFNISSAGELTIGKSVNDPTVDGYVFTTTFIGGPAAIFTNAEGAAAQFRRRSPDATFRNTINFFSGATIDNPCGEISVSLTSTAYGTTSDYRLKENIAPIVGAADKLMELNPCRFNFKVSPGNEVDGFIAHEAQAIVPECVTGTKDALDKDGNPEYQNIDQSKLVPLLTAALQEALVRIAALENA